MLQFVTERVSYVCKHPSCLVGEAVSRYVTSAYQNQSLTQNTVQSFARTVIATCWVERVMNKLTTFKRFTDASSPEYAECAWLGPRTHIWKGSAGKCCLETGYVITVWSGYSGMGSECLRLCSYWLCAAKCCSDLAMTLMPPLWSIFKG